MSRGLKPLTFHFLARSLSQYVTLLLSLDLFCLLGFTVKSLSLSYFLHQLMSLGGNGSWGGSVPSSIPPAFLSHLSPSTDLGVAIFLILTGESNLPSAYNTFTPSTIPLYPLTADRDLKGLDFTLCVYYKQYGEKSSKPRGQV